MEMTLRTVLATMASVLAAVGGARANDEDVLRHEAVVEAPPHEVWNAFTTPEGMEAWSVAHAQVDLRIGGEIRTHYDPAGEIGDPDTIVSRILAYEPRRLLAIQNVRAPASLPFELPPEAWSVMRFEPVGTNRTRVVLSGYGWGPPQYEQAHEFFDRGNALVLKQLQAHFDLHAADAEARDERIMELARGLVGGEWIHRSERDERTLRVRNVFHAGPGGSVHGDGWLDFGSGPFHHGHTVIWREPGGRVQFLNVDEAGAVARGGITLRGDSTLVYDWTMTRQDRERAVYEAFLTVEGDDAYKFRVERVEPDGSRRVQVEADFERTGEGAEREGAESAGGR